jgi:RHS repeat-associated protein
MAEPSGLYYMRARYYDPTVGRFISEDPIGFDGGTVNLYEYVQNNPVNLVDPFGEDPCNPCHCGCTKCHTERMLITGYDNSFVSTGKHPGDPGYGITANQTRAGHGSIAAPASVPFGTGMFVPGYGCGTVQDGGGKIKMMKNGKKTMMHIDVWFTTSQEGNNWGAQYINVEVRDD